jgi:hypothetical protein
MTLISPWTPPTGNTWTPLELYTRIQEQQALSFGQGDQNKFSTEDAVNWIGNKLFEILGLVGQSYLTGDIRMSFWPNPTEGWILLDGRTIGSAGSGSQLTGVVYQDLYNVLWAYTTNADLLTSSGGPTTKGASAIADWSANKRLILPDARGRVIVGAGQGTGLANRLIMSRFGAEGGSLNHAHAVSITTSNSLFPYAPTGTVTVESTNLDYTPEGTVAVDNDNLEYTPTGSITIDSAQIDYTPTGTVTVESTNLDYTPEGTVSVSLINGAVSGTGTANVSGATCTQVEVMPGGEASAIDCDAPLTVSISDIASGLTTNVTVDSASFTGDEDALQHNHIASFQGQLADLLHTHTGSFTGNSAVLTHNHIATFTGTEDPLTHNHTASFMGDVQDFTHNHSVTGNTATENLSYSAVQPSLAAYTYIKL